MTHEQDEARAYFEQAAMWMLCAVVGRSVACKLPQQYAPAMYWLARQSEQSAESAMREAIARADVADKKESHEL